MDEWKDPRMQKWREKSDELLQQGGGWKNRLSANQSGREEKRKREGTELRCAPRETEPREL